MNVLRTQNGPERGVCKLYKLLYTCVQHARACQHRIASMHNMLLAHAVITCSAY